MLIGVSPVISPELIGVLHRMGHGEMPSFLATPATAG